VPGKNAKKTTFQHDHEKDETRSEKKFLKNFGGGYFIPEAKGRGPSRAGSASKTSPAKALWIQDPDGPGKGSKRLGRNLEGDTQSHNISLLLYFSMLGGK